MTESKSTGFVQSARKEMDVDPDHPLYEKVGKMRAYAKSSQSPHNIYSFYEADDTRRPQEPEAPLAPLGQEYEGGLQGAKDQFVELAERMHAENIDVDPMELISFGPELVQMFTADPELANYVADVEYQMVLQRQLDLEEERRIDQAVRDANRRNNFWSLLPFGTTFQAEEVTREDIIAEFERERERLAEEQEQGKQNVLAAAGSAFTNNLFSILFAPSIGITNSASDYLTTLESGERVNPEDAAMGLLAEFGDVVKGTLTGIGTTTQLPFRLLGVSGPLDLAVEYGRDRLAADINPADYELTPEDDLLQQASGMSARDAVTAMREGDPGTYDELILAYGDENTAIAFLSAGMSQTDAVKEQLDLIAEDLADRERMMVEDLEEQDFTFSENVLDILSMYGRNIPGRFATVTTLLLTDRDYQDALLQGQFAETWKAVGEEASSLDFQPSGALGIDGTAIGLFMDLGLGIAFDPVTYLFGPRIGGSLKSVGAKAASEAYGVAKSAIMQRMVDDIVRTATSPSRGASSLHHLMGWLDPQGQAELLEVVGLVTNKIPAGKWRTTAGGTEVATESVRALLHSDDLARSVGALDDVDDVIGSLADNILENGFDEAIEIVVSRSDETIHVTNGIKRLLAAERLDLNMVPVRVRVVDDAARDTVRLAGMNAEQSQIVYDIARGERVFGEGTEVGKALTDRGESFINATSESIKTGRDTWIDVGVARTKDGKQFRVKRATGSADDGTGEWVQYAAVDESGEAVAYVLGSPGKTVEGELAMASRQRGVMEQLWDLARKDGNEFILQSGRGKSISEDALKFTQRYAEKLLKDAAGNLDSTGVPIRNVFPDGLNKGLAEFGEGLGESVHPVNAVFPRNWRTPGIERAAVDEIVTNSLLRGARTSEAGRRAINVAHNGLIRQAVRKLTPESLRRVFTQANTTTRFSVSSRSGIKKILDQTLKIWGDDTAKADYWVERIYRAQAGAKSDLERSAALWDELSQMRHELQALEDMNAGAWDDALREVGPEGAGAVLRNQTELQKALSELQRKFDARVKEVHREMTGMTSHKEFANIIEDMWNDYNRTHIVPRWQKDIDKLGDEIFDAELGIVKWEYLRKGKGELSAPAPRDPTGPDFLPETLERQAQEAGIGRPQDLATRLNSLMSNPMAVNTPISPLELIAAATVSGRAWTKFTKHTTGHMLREATFSLHRAWLIDKVLRPATAMTVSGDELLRIFHTGGWRAVSRYVEDRLLFTQARVHHALHGGNPLSRTAVRSGARYSDRVRRRLEHLDRYTVEARQWERLFYDGYGNGWVDIYPGSVPKAEYVDAAKRWTGQMLQESGFRAFLRGEDAFRDWFYGPDGQHLRQASVMLPTEQGPRTAVLSSVDDAYNGWRTLFEDVILGPAKEQGVFDDVMAAFRQTARQIDEVGGAPIDLPDWVFDHMGPVRGVQKYTRASYSPLRMTDSFFDRFFLDPVNYRRGFLADMVARMERARLESLYATQGVRILSDMEVAEALGYRGMAGASRTGVKDFLAEQALKQGMVPESYIDDLVQEAVEGEIEHMLYVVDKASRAGNVATGTLFPFGKPYADMMAFWGREMMRRPHWRGQINDGNQNMLQDLITAKGNLNPRTPALVSRLAHTDFTIDQGWTGVEDGETAGLFPGSEETDFSPLLFLPTGGENPFYSMIPGVGYVPMWALDMLIAGKVPGLGTLGVDPLEDPLGYQQRLDAIGQVIPGAYFGNADPALSIIQRFLGGGTTSQILEGAMDIASIFGQGNSFRPVSSFLGQPDREIDRGRYASALLSDPQEWQALFELENYEDISLYIDALAAEADTDAARGNLYEQGTRFFLPTGNKYSGELDQIWDVWLRAGQAYPELGGPDGFRDDAATPEERRQYVDDVRNRFFDLPQWQRDAYVAEMPELAVNLISTWDWTDHAHASGIAGATPYRSGGSREELARHQVYIQQLLIRPLSPQERIRRIVGLHLSARKANAKRIYSRMAEGVNDTLWEYVVAPETKAKLEGILSEEPEFSNAYDITTARELWEAWGSYEDDLEGFIASQYDIPEDETEGSIWEALKDAVSIPSKEKPWGTNWPGVDPSQLSGRYAAIPFEEFPEEVRIMADAAGIELVPGMNGEQLYNEIQSVVVDIPGPLQLNVDPSYSTYIGERSAAYRAVDEEMRDIAFNGKYDPEWREGLLEFVAYESNTAERYRERVLGVPPSRQREIQDRFMHIMNTADHNVIADWQALWDLRYERTYGPLGWTPPEPLSPFDDDGNVRGTAYKPVIKRIIDGDSLLVAERAGDQRLHEVRLLGVRARDYGLDSEGAEEDKDRIWDALQSAVDNGDTIYLVRQPDTFGNVDIYGRELAWLWIGDEPFYFSEEMLPSRDPSGGDS